MMFLYGFSTNSFCCGEYPINEGIDAYHILDLYEEPYDPKRPIVNLDEKPKQLLGDKRKAIPMKPGSPEKYNYEYVRNGKATIFMAVEFKAGKRMTQVTENRTMKDFAPFVNMLVDTEYPDVDPQREGIL